MSPLWSWIILLGCGAVAFLLTALIAWFDSRPKYRRHTWKEFPDE